MNVSVNVSMGVCANISFFQISKAWMGAWIRTCVQGREAGGKEAKKKRGGTWIQNSTVRDI